MTWNSLMLRHPVLSFGSKLLIAAFIMALAARPGWAFQSHDPAQQPAVKAEADHGASAGGHGEGGGQSNPMAIQPSLMIWTIVVFLCLLFILTKFAWKPLSQALHQREEHLEHCLLQSEKARNDSEQLLAEHKRLMAQAGDQVKALIDKAHRDAQTGAEEIIKSAQAEAEASRERAERDIASARDQALAEIWSKTADLAVSVAGKVLTKQIGADEHRRLLDLAVKQLPKAGTTNGHGGART